MAISAVCSSGGMPTTFSRSCETGQPPLRGRGSGATVPERTGTLSADHQKADTARSARALCCAFHASGRPQHLLHVLAAGFRAHQGGSAPERAAGGAQPELWGAAARRLANARRRGDAKEGGDHPSAWHTVQADALVIQKCRGSGVRKHDVCRPVRCDLASHHDHPRELDCGQSRC
jgi:hypothetical protein